MAELERICPSSILSGAAPPPDETSAAAVLHLCEGLLKVADAVYNSSVALHQTLQAAAAFDATLQQHCIKPVLLDLCLVPKYLSCMLQSNRMCAVLQLCHPLPQLCSLEQVMAFDISSLEETVLHKS